MNNEFTAIFPDNIKLVSYRQDPKLGWGASIAGYYAPDGIYSYLVKYKELGYVNKFQLTGSVAVIR